MFEMNSYMIATVSIIAAAVLIAATIAVPISSNSVYGATSVAQRAEQSLRQSSGPQNGLVNVGNLGVGVQAQVGANCAIAVLAEQNC